MEMFKVLTMEEEGKLNSEELRSYYLNLRNYYTNKIKSNNATEKVHKLFGNLAKGMRNYSIEIDNESGISFDEPVIFACNHSNTHDYYTVQEVFKRMVNVLVASDSLSGITSFLFKVSGSVLIDRDDKNSCFNGLNRLVENLMLGNNVVIFPESTWNVHPSKLMLPMKTGIIKVAAKSGRPIIPVIFEYVEKNEICSKESELYDKCIVKFGRPIYVDIKDNYLEKLEQLKEAMSTMRWDIWSSLGTVKREKLDDDIYNNHTELKCNSLLFKYAWKKEEDYIYGSNNYIYSYYPINRVMTSEEKEKTLKRVK